MLGFELAQEDYEAITDIDFQLRLVDGIRFLRPEGPFRYHRALPKLARGLLQELWCCRYVGPSKPPS